MRDKDLIKNTIWFGVIPKITSIINLFLLPVVTPYLTTGDYGIIGIINSYSGLFMSICTLGLHMHLPNSFFEYKAKFKPVWRRIFALVLFSSVIFSVLQIGLFLFILPDTSPYSKYLIIGLSVIPILMYANQLIASNYYVLEENPKPLVIRNLIAGITGICITYICITYFRLGYLSWLIAAATSSVLLFILFLKPVYVKENIYPHLPQFNSRIRNYLWIALPVIPHNLGHNLLSSSDRIIMSLFNLDINDIGLYTNGYQMGEYVSFLIVGIFTALNPTLQRAFRSKDQATLAYYLRLTFVSVCVLIVLVSLWMHVIYHIMVRNESLQSAYNIAIVIIFSFMFFPVYSYMSLSVFITKKTQHILWLVFVPGILNIILNIFLIPHFGYKCVAYTTVISYWVVPLISFLHPYYKREMKDMFGKTYFKELACAMLLGILIFIGVVMYFDKLSVIYLIPVSVAIVGIYMLIVKKLRTLKIAQNG